MSVSSGEEWEVISNALIQAQDEAADFLARPVVPGEEMAADLQAKMNDLQETISRLMDLNISGNDDRQPAPMDTETQPEEVAAPMDVDAVHRGGLGVATAVSGGYPEAEQAPQALKAEGSGTAPAGFVRPVTHAPTHQPVRWCLDPENHAFSKLVAFPDSFPSVPNYLVNMLQSCTEQELADLFSRFMHLPLSEAVVRRILEAYIPMKAQCQQEAIWTMGAQKTKSTAGLGMADLKARPLGHQPYTHMCSLCTSGWPDRATSCFIGQKGTRVPFVPPTASYTMDEVVWTLVPVDGKPTWVQASSPAKGAAGADSSTGSAQKLERSIDATQLAQPPGATSSLDEVTMADAVPMALRMSMREEVLEQTVDEDAKEAASLLHEQKQSLAAKKPQGFQVFHPEAAKAMDIQSKAMTHSHLIHQEAAMDEEAKRQKKELVEDAVNLNLHVLGPLQEGIQAVPDSSIFSRGVDLLRRTNLEKLREKMKESLLEGESHTIEAITQAQTSVEEARLANKRIQEQGTEWMKKYALRPEDPSLWPEEFKAKLERGLFCPIDIDDEADHLAPPEINSQYLDFLGELNRGKRTFPPQLLDEMPALAQSFMTPAPADDQGGQTMGMNELAEDAKKVAMLTWAMKFHTGEQRMHAGCWRKIDEVNPPDWALKIKLNAPASGPS